MGQYKVFNIDEIGFNPKKVEDRLRELKEKVKVGDFRWKDKFGGEVEFVEDK